MEILTIQPGFMRFHQQLSRILFHLHRLKLCFSCRFLLSNCSLSLIWPQKPTKNINKQ